MTYEEREKIFSKEVITLNEFAALFSCSLSEASIKMNDIKRRVGDRAGVRGKLHIQDYLDCYKLTGLERYQKTENNEEISVKHDEVRKSIFVNGLEG